MACKIYALHNVVAEVSRGRIRLIIDEPVSLETWGSFREKTNSRKFRERVSQLKKIVLDEGEGCIILADKECPVRLGGGFVQLERGKFILVKRDQYAPRFPLTFDIPAGLFEEKWESPFEMMVAESAEILRLHSDTIYYVLFNKYNESLLSELEKIVQVIHRKGIIVKNLIPIPSKMIQLTTPVISVDYLGSKIENIRLAFEYPDSSIEIIGFIEVLGKHDYAYGDGELNNNDDLLDRKTHVIDMITGVDRVWRLFKLEKKNIFQAELSLSSGVTSKAASALQAINLGHIIRTEGSKLWDVL